MVNYDNKALRHMSDELGFGRNELEKMCRLTDTLTHFRQDDVLKDSLALKGGTAINLAILDLPRLSVDIDLDLTENLSRDAMLEKRKAITGHIVDYMLANGYSISSEVRHSHIIDSFKFGYSTLSGGPDALKIDINYMDRCHVFDPELRVVELPWMNGPLTINCLHPIEIFSTKITALIHRHQARDLFDVTSLASSDLFSKQEQELLRKCVVFYSALGLLDITDDAIYDPIASIPQFRAKTGVLQMVRNHAFFDVKDAKNRCIPYLKQLLQLTNGEKAFLQAFNERQYRPELLFTDPQILSRIAAHPLAVWHCRVKEQRTETKPSVLEELNRMKESVSSESTGKSRGEQELEQER